MARTTREYDLDPCTVVTYSAPSGNSINLTPDQVEWLHAAHKWPRTPRGDEYCQVSHGAHYDSPSYTDEELRDEVGLPPE